MWKSCNRFCEVTKMGSTIDPRTYHNKVGNLRGQRHITSKNSPTPTPMHLSTWEVFFKFFFQPFSNQVNSFRAIVIYFWDKVWDVNFLYLRISALWRMIDELGGALNVYKWIFSSQMIIARNYPGGSRKYYADVLHKLIEENMYVDFIYIFIMRGRGRECGLSFE